jgi:hypothetical protein
MPAGSHIWLLKCLDFSRHLPGANNGTFDRAIRLCEKRNAMRFATTDKPNYVIYQAALKFR